MRVCPAAGAGFQCKALWFLVRMRSTEMWGCSCCTPVGKSCCICLHRAPCTAVLVLPCQALSGGMAAGTAAGKLAADSQVPQAGCSDPAAREACEHAEVTVRQPSSGQSESAGAGMGTPLAAPETSGLKQAQHGVLGPAQQGGGAYKDSRVGLKFSTATRQLCRNSWPHPAITATASSAPLHNPQKNLNKQTAQLHCTAFASCATACTLDASIPEAYPARGCGVVCAGAALHEAGAGGPAVGRCGWHQALQPAAPALRA